MVPRELRVRSPCLLSNWATSGGARRGSTAARDGNSQDMRGTVLSISPNLAVRSPLDPSDNATTRTRKFLRVSVSPSEHSSHRRVLRKTSVVCRARALARALARSGFGAGAGDAGGHGLGLGLEPESAVSPSISQMTPMLRRRHGDTERSCFLVSASSPDREPREGYAGRERLVAQQLLEDVETSRRGNGYFLRVS